MPKHDVKKFQKLIWDFYKKHKRDFPRRHTKNSYHVLVSEVMLQQTQASRVVPFYRKWIKRFPDFEALAKAKFSEIYPYWQGLGYNRRALALKHTAEKVTKEFGGKLPKNVLQLEEFPGIGPYTARAVSIFSFNTFTVCIETNIRRVFIHHFFSRKKNISDREIFRIAQRALPKNKSRQWHWALMDYGTHLKSQIPNPNKRHKNYTIQPKFEGSLRQIRGTILRNLIGQKITATQFIKTIEKDPQKIKEAILMLKKEGLVAQNKKSYSLK